MIQTDEQHTKLFKVADKKYGEGAVRIPSSHRGSQRIVQKSRFKTMIAQRKEVEVIQS